MRILHPSAILYSLLCLWGCAQPNIPLDHPHSKSPRLYWAARDLYDHALGNHHFIAVFLDDPAPARQLGIETIRGGNGQFFTLGTYENEATHTLELRRNYWTDIKAIKESLEPELHLQWYSSDFDVELHPIPIPSDQSPELMLRRLVELSDRFEQNARIQKPKYTPEQQNCSAWVNTMLYLSGVPEQTRLELGEFSGIDWGEEEILSETLFSFAHTTP